METLRANKPQQVIPSINDSIQRPLRRITGRTYMMQSDVNDSVPDAASQPDDCSVSALLDTGSLEATISEVAVIPLGIRQSVNTEDKIMMRAALGHTFETFGSTEVRKKIWEQTMMIKAVNFQNNPDYYDVILGWPDFERFLKLAKTTRPYYRNFLNLLKRTKEEHPHEFSIPIALSSVNLISTEKLKFKKEEEKRFSAPRLLEEFPQFLVCVARVDTFQSQFLVCHGGHKSKSISQDRNRTFFCDRLAQAAN